MKNTINVKIQTLYIGILRRLGLISGDDVYYINGSEILPTPLSCEEENDLISRLLIRDETAKKTLIERNLRLVVYIAKKFENTNINIEDLISIGTIGLMKAINSFDPLKNIKLATYASRCIENEILMYLRRTVREKVEVSFEEPLNTDGDGNELLLLDILGTDNDSIFKTIEEKNEKKLLAKALQKLNKREKLIMELRYGFTNKDEKTQKEVADMLGISQSYISRIEKKIIGKIKKEICN